MKKILFALIIGIITLIPLSASAQRNVTGITGGGSPAYAPSAVIGTTPGTLYHLTVNFHTAAYRSILLIDSAASAAPTGTLTSCATNNADPCVRWCLEGLAQSTDATETTKQIPFNIGIHFIHGLIVVASTSTSGCYTSTLDGNNESYNWLFEP